MDRPMYGQGQYEQPGQPASSQTTELHGMAEQVARWWWLWLIAGALWIVGAVIILQFHSASLVTVGVIVGIMLLVAAAQEFLMATFVGDWRWLSIAFGVLLLIAGIWALIDPIRTFVAVADMLGFLFVLVGAFWTIDAFVTRPVNDLWILGAVAGIMMIVLGFWTGGQFIVSRAYMLLIFVGIWALFHGITDLIRAFRIKQLGTVVGTMGAAPGYAPGGALGGPPAGTPGTAPGGTLGGTPGTAPGAG